MNVRERVIKVVEGLLRVDKAKINDGSDFVNDLGAESIQSIELVCAFEEEFDIEMDEDAALQIKTVGKAVEFVEKALQEREAGESVRQAI